MVRVATKDDVKRMVAVHQESFPGFFLSALGAPFLSQYYRGILAAPEGIAYVYLNQAGEPAGFVAGTANPRGFYRRLLRRSWHKFALAALVPVLKRPRIAGRVARALVHPSGNPVGDHVAGLYSIGVLPELQGTGAGKKLVGAFLDEAARRGCRRVFLTTDRDGNDPVNAFYAGLGFQVERHFETPEGRRMNEYWITLGGET
ncbi:GNAT family N-acetyltransferase [Geomonas propionica]|uniref:GNAT family N-acetyltransferase n=1 Tax=Geomonas propionica TaxID=2798582 RepID=A0ABS0YVF7_9BACT|nr:GNAT family N-acetyltransferase [Geomonas propionica]MBJ6801942.1 GNAT family N-acetyltransferase [Geomonas propionica]